MHRSVCEDHLQEKENIRFEIGAQVAIMEGILISEIKRRREKARGQGEKWRRRGEEGGGMIER